MLWQSYSTISIASNSESIQEALKQTAQAAKVKACMPVCHQQFKMLPVPLASTSMSATATHRYLQTGLGKPSILGLAVTPSNMVVIKEHPCSARYGHLEDAQTSEVLSWLHM